MVADVHHLFPVGGHVPATGDAPPLPVEPHIIGAALTAESMRGLIVQLLLVLQHAPRDGAMVLRLHGELLDAWCKLGDHYSAYREVLECKGQA